MYSFFIGLIEGSNNIHPAQFYARYYGICPAWRGDMGKSNIIISDVVAPGRSDFRQPG